MEDLRSGISLLVLLVFLALVIASVLDSVGLRLGLLALLFHPTSGTGEIQTHLGDLVRLRAETLLARDGVFGTVGGRGRKGGGELEGDLGFGDGGVGDGGEGNGEGGLARDEEGEIVGCRNVLESALCQCCREGEEGNAHWTSATPQFQPLTEMSLVSMVML